MLSNDVVGAFAVINAALDTVTTLDLSALEAQDLLQLGALTEKAIRRHTVVSHDVSHQLPQRSGAEPPQHPNSSRPAAGELKRADRTGFGQAIDARSGGRRSRWSPQPIDW